MNKVIFNELVVPSRTRTKEEYNTYMKLYMQKTRDLLKSYKELKESKQPKPVPVQVPKPVPQPLSKRERTIQNKMYTELLNQVFG